MTKGHVSIAATFDGDWIVISSAVRAACVKALKRLRIGQGEALTITIEPEAEGRKHHQYKALYGYTYKPFCDYTGYTEIETHALMKAMFLPDGLTSTTQLDYDGLEEFKRHADRQLREWMPEAFDEPSAVQADFSHRSTGAAA